MAAALLVPVKAFSAAKVRLAPVLDDAERVDLARTMAERVLDAAGDLDRAVVCDDPEVARWAEQRGAQVIWTPARGLNAAVSDGVARLAAQGVDLVTVAHADLPLVEDLTGLGRSGVAALAPDRRRDGTNVAAVPTGSGFAFSYGPGSFERHCDEARRIGLELTIIERADLSWDIDVPSDLRDLAAARASGWK